MKRSLLQLFPARVVICAALHFGAVWLIGVLLFYRYGFGHPPIRSIYEASLGAGVLYFGLPDTLAGWLANSALYGLVLAAVLSFLRRFSRNRISSSTSVCQ